MYPYPGGITRGERVQDKAILVGLYSSTSPKAPSDVEQPSTPLHDQPPDPFLRMRLAAPALIAATLLPQSSALPNKEPPAPSTEDPAAPSTEDPAAQSVCTGSWHDTPQCCGGATAGWTYFLGLYCETCTFHACPHVGPCSYCGLTGRPGLDPLEHKDVADFEKHCSGVGGTAYCCAGYEVCGFLCRPALVFPLGLKRGFLFSLDGWAKIFLALGRSG